MKYRSEIDGLRAVAVVPVVLFHAGVDSFTGGFVGVDVFFVISGFLITSLILSETRSGHFSLANFYERRARRILPALFLVVLTCLPFAYLWMMPEEMKAFVAGVLSVALSASNFVFYAQSGYFDQAAELKPLLHTWSLAVEEQFYILFPLLVLFLHRYSRRVVLATFVLLFLGSLFLAQTGGNFETQQSLQASAWSWQNLPSWGFYLLPARAWELLLGSIIAFCLFNYGSPRLISGRPLAELGSLSGLALIAYAVVAFDQTTPYPSLYTLVPTLGASLVIVFANPGTIVHRLLSLPAFVGLGLISYSIYLWHHPLFAFARVRSLNEPDESVFLALALISVALAYVTWKFIEQPFRDRRRVETRTLVHCSAIAASCLVAFFAAGRITDGYDYRFSTAEFLTSEVPTSKIKCRRDKDESLSKACRHGVGEPTVAMIGDSHAGSLVNVLGPALGRKGTSVIALHVAGCAPVRNFLREMTGDRCRRQDDVYDYLKAADEIEYVVIAARWATKFEVSRFDNQEGGVELGSQTILYPDVERAGREITLAEAISAGVRELLDDGKTVILVYPIPEAGWDIPNYMAKLKARGELRDDISTSHAVFKSRNARAIAALDGVGGHPNLYRVYPERLFCDTVRDGRCMASLGMKALYRDTNHLSTEGAGRVVAEIVEKIRPPNPIRQSAKGDENPTE